MTTAVAPQQHETCESLIADSRRKRRGKQIRTLRLAVERKEAGEPFEPKETDELESALDQLDIKPKRFDELVAILKRVNQDEAQYGNWTETENELRRIAKEKKDALDAAQLDLVKLRGAWREADHKATIFAQAGIQHDNVKRGCKLMFGTVDEAIAELFPAEILPPPVNPNNNQIVTRSDLTGPTTGGFEIIRVNNENWMQ